MDINERNRVANANANFRRRFYHLPNELQTDIASRWGPGTVRAIMRPGHSRINFGASRNLRHYQRLRNVDDDRIRRLNQEHGEVRSAHRGVVNQLRRFRRRTFGDLNMTRMHEIARELGVSVRDVLNFTPAFQEASANAQAAWEAMNE